MLLQGRKAVARDCHWRTQRSVKVNAAQPRALTSLGSGICDQADSHQGDQGDGDGAGHFVGWGLPGGG